VVDRDDVRVLNRCRRPGFADEALAKAVDIGQLGDEKLERDRPRETQLLGTVDDSHPSASDELSDSVPGELRAGANFGRKSGQRRRAVLSLVAVPRGQRVHAQATRSRSTKSSPRTSRPRETK